MDHTASCLAKDIARAMEEVIAELQMNWKIGIRNGDTNINERQKQKRQMPEVLIITPKACICYWRKRDMQILFVH